MATHMREYDVSLGISLAQPIETENFIMFAIFNYGLVKRFCQLIRISKRLGQSLTSIRVIMCGDPLKLRRNAAYMGQTWQLIGTFALAMGFVSKYVLFPYSIGLMHRGIRPLKRSLIQLEKVSAYSALHVKHSVPRKR
jgi:hypothetical protein